MKKKEYIKPDITIIPMDDEILNFNHISGEDVKYGAGDTGVDKSDFNDLQSGEHLGNGIPNTPKDSKKNQMWDLWEY